jgi:hypothetical protein
VNKLARESASSARLSASSNFVLRAMMLFYRSNMKAESAITGRR